jgi:Domain of unknown function (DUF4412)
MKQISFISSIAFSICLLLACSGNSSASGDKDSTSTNAASGGSGKDMYYEYTLTTTGKDITMNGVTKLYISSKGDMRSEMNMTSSLVKNKTSAPIVTIGHSNKPDESIIIDDDAKTYTINHFNTSDFNTGEKVQSTVTKIGEEKIMGFNCVHARVISKKSMGSLYSDMDTIDLWRSEEVPLLASVKELMDKFEAKTGNTMYSTETVNQLKQIGCEGFMVKMTIGTKNSSTKEELTKVEHRDFSVSMFQIPAGYKEDKEGL